jgi:hypothetical protein
MNQFVDQLEQELRAASRRRVRLEAARVPRPRAAVMTMCVSVLVCVGVALAVVQVGGSRPTSRHRSAQSPTTGHRTSARKPVNPQIAANFAPFRRPRTAADALPRRAVPRSCLGPAWNGGPNAAAIQGLGAFSQIFCGRGRASLAGGRALRQVIGRLQRNQARAVRLPGGLGKVWLIPSGKWLCNLWRPNSHWGAMACETIHEVLTHPPLWPGGMWCLRCGPSDGAYLIGLEPDRVTHVAFTYLGGSRPAHLANNVVLACEGEGSAWLVQSGPTIKGTIVTSLGGGKLDGQPARFRARKCPGLG